MIADLKRYPAYKESGLPWLEQVPEQWYVQRTKWRFRHRKQLNADGENTNVLSLTLRGVVNNDPEDPEGLVPKDYRTYQLFAKGDLVFKLIDLENLRTSRVGLVHEDGIMSSAYVRLVPATPTNMRFFFYQFYDLYSRGIYNQLGAGVRSTLGPSDLLNVEIVIPSPTEQAVIVRFLDWVNGRLERAIRAKRKIIGLLNEQRQAIINRAVTRGLDPSVPLKPSGVPWLGEIPRHWYVRRVSSLARFASGKAHEQFFEPMAEHICVTARFVSTGGALRKFSSRNNCPAVRGDVLMVMSDLPNGRALARAYLVRDDKSYAVNQRVCRLTPHSIEPRFLAYCANRSPHFLRQDDGMNQTHLSNYDFKTLPVALPSFAEQVTIANYIEREATQIDITISRLEREIELLREYRTRLVADVVTGKLDVREVTARLPAETQLDDNLADKDLTDEAEAIDDEAVA